MVATDLEVERATDRPSLDEGLSGHDNALNFLRLVLAVLVILGHSSPIGGFGMDQLEIFSDGAVDGFFVLSGFLIAGSRMRLGILPFLWRRFLRIMPGFWVCLVVVAFGFAPLASLFPGEQFDVASAADYVTNNSRLQIHQWGIDGTLASVPLPEEWNSSLWTLVYEFRAYLLAGLLLTLPPLRRFGAMFFPLLAVAAGAVALAEWGYGQLGSPWMDADAKRFFAFFAAGMALYFLRTRLPSSLVGAGVAALALSALRATSYPLYLACAPLLLGYVLLVLGGRLPVRWGARNDISYGIYIYAFPIQQMIALAGGHVLGVVGFAALSTALTVPLAWLSWKLVEQPAMRLRRLAPARIRG